MTTMNPATRRLIQVEAEDEEIMKAQFDLLLGENCKVVNNLLRMRVIDT